MSPLGAHAGFCCLPPYEELVAYLFSLDSRGMGVISMDEENLETLASRRFVVEHAESTALAIKGLIQGLLCFSEIGAVSYFRCGRTCTYPTSSHRVGALANISRHQQLSDGAVERDVGVDYHVSLHRLCIQLTFKDGGAHGVARFDPNFVSLG